MRNTVEELFFALLLLGIHWKYLCKYFPNLKVSMQLIFHFYDWIFNFSIYIVSRSFFSLLENDTNFSSRKPCELCLLVCLSPPESAFSCKPALLCNQTCFDSCAYQVEPLCFFLWEEACHWGLTHKFQVQLHRGDVNYIRYGNCTKHT